MKHQSVYVLLPLAMALTECLPANAAENANSAAVACEALSASFFSGGKFGSAFAQIPDAPTTVVSAKIISAGGDGSVVQDDLPEICRVEGQIAPTVGFLLRMPTKNWNGKFMMGGCGGPCGNYLEDRIDPALVRNYAVVTTDMGHKGNGWAFGYNDLQGLIDFGFRATHVTAVRPRKSSKRFTDDRRKKITFRVARPVAGKA